MQKPHVQFARTRDGVSIAYRCEGQGRPIVFLSGWVSHLESESTEQSVLEFLRRLGHEGHRRLVLFDWRGTGLSDRDVSDFSAEARARDIEAVVDAAGVDRVALVAWALSGGPAIVYAAEHPDRVSHLVLYGTLGSPFTSNPALGRALVGLVRADWKVGARTMVEFVFPEADREAVEKGMEFVRVASSGETAAAILEEGLFRGDVRPYLPRLTTATLVLHRREDPAIPLAAGRELASLIPNARFVPLPGSINTPFFGDSDAILHAVDNFIEGDTPSAAGTVEIASGLVTILFTDLAGSTALTQRLGDAGAQDLLRAHNAVVRACLREHGGTELKTMGDGFMASFPLASAALECAIAIQRGLAAANGGGAEPPLRVRIGLNAGEPLAEEADLFGTAVQAAARIAAKAKPGTILVADVVRQLAAGKSFRFLDRGRTRLKGFEERLRLFELEY
jgi:class 3 adenylate cyclase/pimeloyl-ACP methyl ester carboxylesterase